MNRNKNCVNKCKPKGGKPHNKCGNNGKPVERYDDASEKLNAEGRPNDPNYYFLDKNVANQVSQLSFQTLGGVPRAMGSVYINYPNIKAHYWNPSAGVSMTTNGLNQSGINMAGLRLFTKLSAYTGRTAVYGPQDLSTMILALGEIISVIEWIRRVFGIAFLGSEQNRTYPRALMQAMRVNDVDFYPRYAEYRNRFNKIVTLVNQIPIPQNIAYFDKCAHMFEKVYLDAPSPLATAIVDNIATMWLLDETGYSGGTVLKTCTFTVDKTTGLVDSPQNLSYYLDWAEYLVNAMLNSSTLQIVYTDMLNLASKMQVKFWKFDYLIDGYMVIPEYNEKYLLQMHNATIVGMPDGTTFSSPNTPLNDVYPDAGSNALVYNPCFAIKTNAGGDKLYGRFMSECVIDSITPDPDVVDRIEMIRWVSLGYGTRATINSIEYDISLILPDHYLEGVVYYDPNNADPTLEVHSSQFVPQFGATGSAALLSEISKVDWDNMYYWSSGDTSVSGQVTYSPTGASLCDLNYYTVIDRFWLKPIFDFTALALYDMR